MAHVSLSKKQEVKTLKTLIDSYPVVGLVDVEGIKAKQLQMIRQDMRGEALIRASKNTLLAIALKKSKKKLEKLASCLSGGASLICSNTDPFRLNMLLEKSRTPSPARPGDVAPEDIAISAGDTGFPPGPLVGELQRAGVPARIERGSIIVQKEHVFVKAGEIITEKQAEILGKLGMEPMTAGLELLGACDDGQFFDPTVLHIDLEHLKLQLAYAHQNAVNLGVEACIMTEETIAHLIQKAIHHSTSLALHACIITPETIPTLLARAYSTARTMKDLITGEPVPHPVSVAEEETEEKEEALEGLGALFG
jgi:large subunit ribosomal protein L10